MLKMRTSLALQSAVLLAITAGVSLAQNDPDKKEWIQAFNGKNLDGWVMKIAGYDLGVNHGNTFRVEDGVMKVSYDQYQDFGNHFGHIFYRTKLSLYIVGVEYRFVGDQVKGGP